MDSGEPGGSAKCACPEGLAPHHCHHQNGFHAHFQAPTLGSGSPRSYSVVKSWHDGRNQWRPSSSAIPFHFTFVQCLGQPTGAWQPHKPGRWAAGTGVELEGSGLPEGGHSSAPSLVVLWACGTAFLDLLTLLPNRSRKFCLYGTYCSLESP